MQRTSSTVVTHLYRGNARTQFVQQPDGTFTNTIIPAFRGSKMTANADGTYTLRHKDGATIGFDSQGRQTSRGDRHGNTVTITRGTNTATATITNPAGGTRTITWQDVPVSQVMDSTGRTVRYQYDANARLTSVTDLAGGVTQYAYDSQHRMTAITDPRGITFLQNTYDVNSRVCQQQQADGGVFTLYYVTVDTANSPESTLLLQQAEAGGPISQAPCTATASTTPVVATVLVDPRGHPTTYRFNAFGALIQTTDALGHITTYEREDGTNLLLATTDPLGRRTAYTYDAMGNVLTVTRLAGTADAVTTTYTYESVFNQVATVRDPLNHTTTVGYDASGNVTSITNPLGQSTTLTYDSGGQPLTIMDALGNIVRLAYDEGGLATVTDPTGRVTTSFYDGAGRLLTLTTPLGQRTRHDYDALNQLTKITDPLGGLTQFSYDGNGNLLSLTDARNSVTSYAYDPMDRAATRTDPLGHAESYAYDLNGNLITVTDRKSQVTSTTYDALDRRTHVTYADGSSTSYTWDAGNALVQIADSLSGTITRTYDGLDRLIRETTPRGTVSYTYDAAGRRTTMTAGDQTTVTYAYDSADRVTQIQQGTNLVSFSYDAAGRRTSLTLPNGVTASYAYDAASRVTAISYTNAGGSLGTLTYSYDANGRRTLIGGTWARTGLPQPVTDATYNANNQQVTFNGQTLSFDLNGNLTTDGANTYSWNARDQLVGIVNASFLASFSYDGIGRRRGKLIEATGTEFLYDGLNPVQELSGASVVADLLTGLTVDEYFQRTDVNGANFIVTDALNSVSALIDVSGSLLTTYTFEPFGTATASGTSTDNSYMYTGREDDRTGLHYYRARYYHPGLQRFIGEDPIEFEEGDVNRYAYVGNRPTDTTDPLGLFGIEDLPAIPQGVLDAVSGFGDAFLVPMLVRPLLGVDDVVDKCSTEYRRGMFAGVMVGSVPFIARGAAALGATRLGHVINHNRYLRFGPGRMDAAGIGLPGGSKVPRVSVGQRWIHRDLRSRLPYVPPIGLAGRKGC